jgi:hypothetical protein
MAVSCRSVDSRPDVVPGALRRACTSTAGGRQGAPSGASLGGQHAENPLGVLGDHDSSNGVEANLARAGWSSAVQGAARRGRGSAWALDPRGATGEARQLRARRGQPLARRVALRVCSVARQCELWKGVGEGRNGTGKGDEGAASVAGGHDPRPRPRPSSVHPRAVTSMRDAVFGPVVRICAVMARSRAPATAERDCASWAYGGQATARSVGATACCWHPTA